MTIGDHNSSNANEYIISSSHTPMSVPSSLSYVSQNSASPRFASTIMNHSAFLSKHWLPDISESYAQLENKFIKLDNIGNNCFCNINTNDMESSIIASSLHSLKSCNFQLRAGISLLFVLQFKLVEYQNICYNKSNFKIKKSITSSYIQSSSKINNVLWLLINNNNNKKITILVIIK